MRTAKAFGIFILVQALFAVAAWVGGYNFNYRSGHVGYVVSFSLAAGVFLAGVYFHLGEGSK